MNDKLKQLEALIEGFSFIDFLDKDNGFQSELLWRMNQRLEYKIRQMQDRYFTSDNYSQYRADFNAKLRKARAARTAKKNAAIAWCEKNLTVGDWVRVRGTRSSLKNRVVTGINNSGFVNQGGDPLTNKVHYLSTWTGFGSITHVFNKESRIMEKIDVVIARSQSS